MEYHFIATQEGLDAFDSQALAGAEQAVMSELSYPGITKLLKVYPPVLEWVKARLLGP